MDYGFNIGDWQIDVENKNKSGWRSLGLVWLLEGAQVMGTRGSALREYEGGLQQ